MYQPFFSDVPAPYSCSSLSDSKVVRAKVEVQVALTFGMGDCVLYGVAIGMYAMYRSQGRCKRHFFRDLLHNHSSSMAETVSQNVSRSTKILNFLMAGTVL